jgi:hypothetical protein
MSLLAAAKNNLQRGKRAASNRIEKPAPESSSVYSKKKESNAARECPSCGSLKTQITDSRPHTNKTFNFTTIKRRVTCAECSLRWTTFELRDDQLDALVKDVAEANKTMAVKLIAHLIEEYSLDMDSVFSIFKDLKK